MKNISINIKGLSLALLFVGLFMSSCQDFLDQDPQDFVSEAVYYETPDQFELAANYLYTRLGYESGTGGTSQVGSQEYDAASDLSTNIGYGSERQYGQGYSLAPNEDDVWEDNYNQMRAVNQLLDKVELYPGEVSEIAVPMGTAYFFRAWHHNKLLVRFGGVPIVTTALDISSEVLYGPRNSRYEVAKQIFDDLDQAIALLPSQSSLSSSDLGKLSKEAAQAFKARILLFQATWEKYVGNSTDGEAGSAKPAGYPSVDDMLNEAKSLASGIITGGQFELWDKRAELGDRHLHYLFTLDDGGDNPAGLTKADNKEFIFQTIYDYTFRQTRHNNQHAMPVSPNRKLMDMYLCTDGLPIQHSSLFQGYDNMVDEFQNRDLRVASFVAVPIDYYWGYGASGRGGGGIWNENIEDQSFDFRYVPNLDAPSNGRNLGYQGFKMVSNHRGRQQNEASENYPLIRYGEVLLIYAEATVELGSGSISDGDLDLSINLLRERAGVAPLTAALIAPYSDLNMLGEIRRERGIELFGEGFRFSDLKRWGIAETELNRNICTAYVQYGGASTEYETAVNPKDPSSNIFDPAVWAHGLTTEEEPAYSYSGIATTKAGALIIDNAGNRLFSKKNYLDPVPTTQIELNPALKQNPGWGNQ